MILIFSLPAFLLEFIWQFLFPSLNFNLSVSFGLNSISSDKKWLIFFLPSIIVSFNLIYSHLLWFLPTPQLSPVVRNFSVLIFNLVWPLAHLISKYMSRFREISLLYFFYTVSVISGMYIKWILEIWDLFFISLNGFSDTFSLCSGRNL